LASLTELSIGIGVGGIIVRLNRLIASIPWLVVILVLIAHLFLWLLIIFGGRKSRNSMLNTRISIFG